MFSALDLKSFSSIPSLSINRRVLPENLEDENKKSKKKKRRDKQDELSNLCETPSVSAIPAPKISKHKLEESSKTLEVKGKKSKKEDKLMEPGSTREKNTKEIPAETPSSKKKTKRVSISTVDETDFIPRFSLDVSQLPENLPPPNADSTHFDFGKNMSSLLSKSEKKKSKNHEALSLIREESSHSNKGLTLESSAKIQLSGVEKVKKKKDKKEKIGSKQDSVSLDQTRYKDIDVKYSRGSSQIEADTNSLSETNRKRKQKSNGKDEATPKEKKSKKEKVNHTSLSNPAGNDILSQSNSKSKKQKTLKEEIFSTPSKHLKDTKEKVKQEKIDDAVASDETIPPGQRMTSGSPQKRLSLGTPQKQLSLSTNFSKSPGIGYFAGSTSMVDLDLGTRKGARAAPLTFGNLRGKVSPPPESPMKSPPSKKTYDSDSDTSLPKKVVVSGSMRRQSSDSEEDKFQAISKSPSKANHTPKHQKTYSDDSDSDGFVQSKLLQSMGVMQSPLKTAKSNLKRDTSDSDSDDNTYARRNNKVLTKSPTAPSLPKAKEHLSVMDTNLKLKTAKPTLEAKTKSPQKKCATKLPLTPIKSATPSKLDKQVSRQAGVSPPKGKGVSAPRENVEDSDSDTDLELMKNALQDMLQEKISGVKAPSKPALKSRAKSKNIPPRSKSEAVEASTVKPTSTSVKKSVIKSSDNVLSDKNTSVGTSQTKSLTNVSYGLDSDSGPDDRNTTKQMEELRQKRIDEEIVKKKKLSAKRPKGQKISEPNISSLDPKKKKNEPKEVKKSKELDSASSTKGFKSNATSQVNTEKDSTKGKKPKGKGKKVDEDITDVMQRLLRQAMVDKGLA